MIAADFVDICMQNECAACFFEFVESREAWYHRIVRLLVTYTTSGELRHRGAANRILPVLGEAKMSLPEFKQLVDEAKSQIKEIGPADLKNMQHNDENFTLIDVREPDEVAKGVISGAVPMPRGILEVNIDKITTDKDHKLVLYCGGGSRSALAALNLKKMGFRDVISLAGGYRGWREAGNE
jgi:rhodanese-related sulfurtransferase